VSFARWERRSRILPADCVLASERIVLPVVHRKTIVRATVSAGLLWKWPDDVVAAIAYGNDGVRSPVLVLVDGWVMCAWITVQALARGGVT
jgi:hypothetical protein